MDNNSKYDCQLNPEEFKSPYDGYCIEYDAAAKLYSVINPVGEFMGKFNSDDVENAIEQDFDKRFVEAFGTEDIIIEEDDDFILDDLFDKLLNFK